MTRLVRWRHSYCALQVRQRFRVVLLPVESLAGAGERARVLPVAIQYFLEVGQGLRVVVLLQSYIAELIPGFRLHGLNLSGAQQFDTCQVELHAEFVDSPKPVMCARI